MGAYAQQLQEEHLARRTRLGMAPKPAAVVDRRTIPPMRKIEKLDPDLARSILADEFIRNWPAMPAVSGTPVVWNCSMPAGLRFIPANIRGSEKDQPISGPTMQQIVSVVAREFEATRAEIRGRSKSVWAILPRQVSMYLGYRAGLSSGCVSTYLGGRDHATALHGRRKIAERVKLDREFAATVARLEAQLSQ